MIENGSNDNFINGNNEVWGVLMIMIIIKLVR